MTTLAKKVGSGHATEQPADTQAAASSLQKIIRSSAVIILERDGSLVQSSLASDASENVTSGYATLPAELVRQNSSVIDRVIDFAFDTLGLTSLDVRISEHE